MTSSNTTNNSSAITPAADSNHPGKIEESPTTREEMDFDDEQEAGPLSSQGHEPSPASALSPRPRVSFQTGHDEIPPTKPPRPASPMQQAENTLIEAFPTIDTQVVKAVLRASGGKVEPAFNALLGMSDPDAVEETAPPQPPRPPKGQPMSQLEADELYARQLADQYNNGGQRSQTRYNQREPGRRGPNQQRAHEESDEERERSFFEDELPEIGRNIQQGFMETQKRVNSWITNFKKKIDGEDEEDELYTSSQAGSRQNTGMAGRQNFGSSQSEQLYGIRKSAEQQRRSTDAQRYDADPREFDAGEFERLELRDEETPPPQPPRSSSRKTANPDLFKSQPKPPQSGPVDEVDAVERKLSAKDASDSEKSKKWQPLTSVAPHPEDDNDPFSLGDDDDEKEKTDDLRKEDTERLKESAKHTVGGGDQAKSTRKLSESEAGTGGVRDKEAEELLSGQKS